MKIEDEYIEVTCDCIKCNKSITGRIPKICLECCMDRINHLTISMVSRKHWFTNSFRDFTLVVLFTLPVFFFMGRYFGIDIELAILFGVIYGSLYPWLIHYAKKLLKWD